MRSRSSLRVRLARLFTRYLIHWYALTTLSYAAMIPLTIYVFPATTLLLTIVVLFGSFTASVASLASVLVDTAPQEEVRDAASDDVA